MAKNAGFTWHCHHTVLLEFCYDYNKRKNIIKTTKSKNEIETRLRLFKFVKGKLPGGIIKTGQKQAKAWQKWQEAWVSCGTSWQEYNEAWLKYNAVGQEWKKALSKYKNRLEALHKQECGCKEWNGKEIVFPKEIK